MRLSQSQRVERVAEFESALVELIEHANEQFPEIAMQMLNDAYGWYPDAYAHCTVLSHTYNVNVLKVAGIMAAMSIQTRWHKNVADVERFLLGKNIYGLPLRVSKSDDIMMLSDDETTFENVMSILNGCKITCFYDNIVNGNNSTRATIDTWMCRAFGIKNGIKGSRYEDAEQATINVAAQYNLSVPVLQAWVWCLVRGKAD